MQRQRSHSVVEPEELDLVLKDERCLRVVGLYGCRPSPLRVHVEVQGNEL